MQENMNLNPLEKAIGIALEAHRSQQDKYGQPYIMHPIRIMARFTDPLLQQIAMLHDVVEDSEWTCEQLTAQGFSLEIVQAVDALTRRPDESYDSLIDRAAAHPLAIQVKLADLEDNMDIRRMKNTTDHDCQRLNRYRKAHANLTAIKQQSLKTLSDYKG